MKASYSHGDAVSHSPSIKNLMNITPSQALIQIKAFFARVERLKANNYRPDSLGRNTGRKKDKAKLRDEMRTMGNLVKVAAKHKHPEKVRPVLEQIKPTMIVAMGIGIDDAKAVMDDYAKTVDFTHERWQEFETILAKMLSSRKNAEHMPGFEHALESREE